MNISEETYIKMCEKAEEIQKEWNPMPGDFIHRKFTLFGEEIDREIWPQTPMWEINIVYWGSMVESYWACSNEKGESRIYKHPAEMRRETSIWLPRQDQLQEMVINFDRGHDNYGVLFGLMKFSADYNLRETSMEQLWLAFVMKKKFNKTWDGEKWII